MAQAPWKRIHLDEIDPITVAEGVGWKPLRRTLGVRAFGINAFAAVRAGEPVIEKHTESQLQHEEVYVVLTGRATFSLDDETVDAPAGTVVSISDHTITRSAVAAEDGTTVLAVGNRVGEAYTPSAWEAYFLAERHRPEGRFDLMAAELEAALEEFPRHPGVLFNLACAEAMGGKPEAALEHLRQAVEIDPRHAEWARADSDLDAIRGLPGFPTA